MTQKLTYEELEQKVREFENNTSMDKPLDRDSLATLLQFKDIVQSLPDPTFVIDRNKKIVAWNHAIEKMTGLSSEEMIGKGDNAYSIPFWGEPRQVLIDLIMDQDQESNFPYGNIEKNGNELISEAYLPKFRGGKSIYVWLKASPLYDRSGNLVGAIEAIRDITEKKLTEKALQKEKDLLSAILDSNPYGIAMTDHNGQYLYVNPKFTQITGYLQKDIPSKKEWFEKAYPDADYRKIIIKRWENDKIQLGGIEDREFKIRCKNGQSKYIEFRSTFLKDQIISVLTDVTQRKEAEVAQRESEEKLKAILEANPDPMVVYDLDGYPLYLNPAFIRIFGWSLDELKGKTIPFVPDNQKKRSYEKIKRMYKDDDAVIFFETKRYTKDHQLLDVLLSAAINKNDKGKPTGMVVNLTDITEKKALEIKYKHAQKLESIGILAGGIAHDFNNILFPITGNTEMLLNEFTDESSVRKKLEMIYRGSMRARDLVKQILTFSSQNIDELKRMKIQPIIREALKLIRSSIPTTIKIRQDINADCDEIKADPTQIHQVMMNLATNAYHAMEDAGGELKVSLKEIKLDEYNAIALGMKAGVYACLTVADTGKGMDKDTIKKIFDPFFTTKKTGKGTGMGLSVVHGIVKNMNGTIKVDSGSDKGSEFRIYLPVFKNLSEKQELQAEKPIQRGTERILLVDDEENIVTMEKNMLERLGYKVTSRTSSIEALEAFRALSDKFDIIITDMQMPNMSGDKLAGELTKIRPDIPILLCTGFSEVMSEEKAESLGIKGFLLKPIAMMDLSHKIRAILDKNQTGATP
ncbi:MAG: PAS domain S-box protein [Desulfobacteraceae bacterium]|nr:PAS domain S-box protein [Desulfobacteraceae bacterium]